ncbi:thermonuclease family protein [Sphingomonas sabuli]|uniref:Thermonuclease family protein n=1 Tax=Sphingomonas sabuli TaxID=2764186 RepID=A0A7G9L5K6_9SPHN|nr:thermonuclease family protein [Sphingomonas sabuli]QNM83905.1 thermonuclease family protein [Sphingomonas sabuli]
MRRLQALALAAILLVAGLALDPVLVDPPFFLQSGREHVSARFTRCGIGRGHACVIDGDTFKLGQRKIRIIGIDAPEIEGQCPAERRQAAAAAAELQRLLNQGPFVMIGRIDDMRDRYGRDLRSIERDRPGGATQSIAEAMREGGFARRYAGFKMGWC